MPLRVLFLCTANSARSQLAEALLQSRGDTRVSAASAGTRPAARVHPMTLEVLRERGTGIEGAHPKSLDAPAIARPDVIVSVCDSARDECPVVPGSLQVHWGLPDPAAVAGGDDAVRNAFRATADVLDACITRLLALPLEVMTARELADALDRMAPVSPVAE